MNVDTDTQYAFTRPVAAHMFANYDGVLKVDGEVGNKKAYDPRAWGKAARGGHGRSGSSRRARTCAAPASVGADRATGRGARGRRVFSLWGTLIPLILGCALVPVQSVVTILLLRSEGGRPKAVGWVAGMTSARIVQGLLFALLLRHQLRPSPEDADDGPGAVASFVLLLVALTMLLSALGAALKHDDPDAPPPRWLSVVDRISPANAFGIGTAMILLSVKFWVFTVGAVSAIANAELPLPERLLVVRRVHRARRVDPVRAAGDRSRVAGALRGAAGPHRGLAGRQEPRAGHDARPGLRALVPGEGPARPGRPRLTGWPDGQPAGHPPDQARRRAGADRRPRARAGRTPAELAAEYPASSLPWAVLAEQALAGGRTIEGYAYARTGYHRGLDALRRSGWRGQGPVPWSHEPNRGFLRALHALGVAAGAIGEDGRARALRDVPGRLRPAAARELG